MWRRRVQLMFRIAALVALITAGSIAKDTFKGIPAPDTVRAFNELLRQFGQGPYRPSSGYGKPVFPAYGSYCNWTITTCWYTTAVPLWGDEKFVVWYRDSPVSGDSQLSSYDLYGYGVDAINVTNPYYSVGVDSEDKTDNDTLLSLNERNLRLYEEGAKPNAEPYCQGLSYHVADKQAGIQLERSWFPSVGVQMRRAERENGIFDYVLYERAVTASLGYYSYNVPRFEAPFTYSCDAIEAVAYTNIAYEPERVAQWAIGTLNNAMLRGLLANEIVGVATMITSFSWPVGGPEGSIAVFVGCFTALTMLFMPDFANRLLLERDSRLLLTLHANGLKLPVYWLVTCLLELLVNVLCFLIALVVWDDVGLDAFHGNVFGNYFGLALSWSFALMGLVVFVAGLSKRRTALSIGFLLTIPLVAYLCAAYERQHESHRDWNDGLRLLPPFAWTDALGLLARRGASISVSDGRIAEDFGLLWLSGTVMLALGLALNTRRVLRSQHGRKGAPLLSPVPSDEYRVEDAEVERERENVADLSAAQHYAARAIDLYKAHPRGKDAKASAVALHGLSFGVKRGECFGLLGPVGSGKTTVLHILSGWVTASGGEAYVDDRPVQNRERMPGIASADTPLWDHLTVRETLLFYARLRGAQGSQHAHVEHVAKMTALGPELLDRCVGALTQERRRVCLAVSLIGNPSLWILDEPLVGLSAPEREAVRSIVAAQKSAGRSVLLSTASASDAYELCDRIGVLREGRLCAIGTPAHIAARYGSGFKLTLFVADNFESPVYHDRRSLVQALTHALQEVCPEVLLLSAAYKKIIYHIPCDAQRMASLLQALENNEARFSSELGVGMYVLNESRGCCLVPGN